MLIANIDLNKPTEPERHIQRLVSATNITQVYQSEEYPEFRRQVHKRRGVILRKGDKRRRERRHESGESLQPERKRRSLARVDILCDTSAVGVLLDGESDQTSEMGSPGGRTADIHGLVVNRDQAVVVSERGIRREIEDRLKGTGDRCSIGYRR